MDYLHDIQSFLPGIVVAVTGLAAILLTAFKKGTASVYYVSVTGLVIAFALAIQSLFGDSGTAFSVMFVYGGRRHLVQ